MNKETQNLLISEYLGFHRVLYGKGRWSPSSPETNLIIGIDKDERRWTHFCDDTSCYRCDLDYTYPRNYAGSLDAIHEAEKRLTIPEQLRFYQELCHILETNLDGTHKYGVCMYWETIHANAAQRAEAFLKTIGKWE